MTILFVILPFPSHYMASFGFAKQWQQAGYRVVFTGYATQREMVEAEGFIFYEIVYETEHIIRDFKIFIGLWIKSLLDKTYLRYRYRIWWKAIFAFQIILKLENPKIVFIDEHLSYYSLYITNRAVKTAILNTKLSTKRQSNIPPLNSLFRPYDNLLSKFWCWTLWNKHLLYRELLKIINNLAFHGKSTTFFQSRLANKLNIKIDLIFNKNNAFYLSLNNAIKINLAPRILEFNNYKQHTNEYFINPKIERQEILYMTKMYLSMKEELKLKRKNNSIRIIYASFGTLAGGDNREFIIFLNKLINVFRERCDWFLVLSISKEHINFIDELTENIINIPFAPQLDILTWCDAMITHGGLTTIKECIQAGVPMLVYPLNYKMDQPGNAARVYYHKLGLVGNMKLDSSYKIRTKINKVLSYRINKSQPDETIPVSLLEKLLII